MKRAALLSEAKRHGAEAFSLHVQGRLVRAMGNVGAADLAWQMRDVARKMSLEAFADAEVSS